jgi:acyl carrier protein
MALTKENSEIFGKVKKIISEVLRIDEEKILLKSKIIDDLGAESLDLVTLLMEFEDGFNSKIPDQDAEKLQTVESVVYYISNKITNSNIG